MAELGFELDGDEFEAAFKRFKALADKKKAIFNEDLEVILADAASGGDERLALGDLSVNSGTFQTPTATVEAAGGRRGPQDDGAG